MDSKIKVLVEKVDSDNYNLSDVNTNELLYSINVLNIDEDELSLESLEVLKILQKINKGVLEINLTDLILFTK